MASIEERIRLLKNEPPIKIIDYEDGETKFELIFCPATNMFKVGRNDEFDRIAAMSLSRFMDANFTISNSLFKPFRILKTLWQARGDIVSFNDMLPLNAFLVSGDYL